MTNGFSLLVLSALAVQLGQTAALPTTAHQQVDERAVLGPAITPVGTSVAGYTAIGCYQDTYNTNAQILSNYQFQPLMTIESCAAFCKRGAYTYMGVSNGQWCYCDNSINLRNGLGYPTSSDNCAVPCAGNLGQNCGSFWTNSMFMVTDKYNAAVASSSSAAASASQFSATSAAAASSLAASISASASVAQSVSVSASLAASRSVAASISASASVAASLQASASVAQSLAASASVAQSLAASASVAQSLAASASVAQSLAASASVAQSLAASASVAQSIAASASASASRAQSLAASASVAQSLAASASVAQSLAASASVAQSIAASASVAASVAASASVAQSLAASASVAQSLVQSIAASSSAASSRSASAAAASSSSASASAAAASSSAAAAAAATATPAPWVAASASCVAEGSSGRALTGDSISGNDMTYTKCLNYCASKNFAIAGLEFGSECYCGNALVNGASLSKTSGQCNMACSGSATKTCGGPDALTVFVIPEKVSSLSSDLTVKAASLPDGWSVASTPCVAEGNNGRALTGAATAADDMTPSKCASFCGSRGFKYAGVEYSSECYCGNSFDNGASLDKASNACNMACSGDKNTMCGGGGALNVFTNPSIVPPVQDSKTPVNSAALPSGWAAASSACIQEVSGRALTGASIAGNSMTIGTCLNFCQSQGFSYAGLEYGQECYCGNALVNGADLSKTSGQCNMPCAADSTSTCGGPSALQLYTNAGNVKANNPAPVVVGGYQSSGCIQEVAGRALTGLRVDYTDMTIDKCTAACKNAGFSMAGVEYGQECYCGNSLVNGASTSQTSGQCYMDCPGNSAQKCGGPNAIQLYTAL